MAMDRGPLKRSTLAFRHLLEGYVDGSRWAMTTQKRRSVTRVARVRSPVADMLARDPILAKIVERLVHALRPDRIYLFGSRARGEAGPDSDYDLMVVVPASDLAPHRRDVLAFRALCGIGAAKDVVVYTREEFEWRSKAASSLPATVLREGRLVYAA